MKESNLRRATLAEFIGTAFLLAAIVGSGIMAERLSGDGGVQLLANTFATCAALVALILTFSSVSGAHFNPAVTLADFALGGIDRARVFAFVPAQIAGGALGVVVANVMFDLDPVNVSQKARSGATFTLSEGVATLGLLLVIFGVSRAHSEVATAFAVGGYIAGAFFFTPSTSFANPAVTVARTLSDTFAGVSPGSAPAFIAAQLVAVVVAVGLVRVLFLTSE